MALNTDHFSTCILTLESSLAHLKNAKSNSIEYEVFRNATIKGFELTLETAGKLLRKTLKLYSNNPHSVDELIFKDVLRQAVIVGILDNESVKRWFKYRDNRNNTAHDYGKAFAEETLQLLPDFLTDAKNLQNILKTKLQQKNA